MATMGIVWSRCLGCQAGGGIPAMGYPQAACTRSVARSGYRSGWFFFFRRAILQGHGLALNVAQVPQRLGNLEQSSARFLHGRGPGSSTPMRDIFPGGLCVGVSGATRRLRASVRRSARRSLNHLVRLEEHRRRKRQAERLGGLHG